MTKAAKVAERSAGVICDYQEYRKESVNTEFHSGLAFGHGVLLQGTDLAVETEVHVLKDRMW